MGRPSVACRKILRKENHDRKNQAEKDPRRDHARNGLI